MSFRVCRTVCTDYVRATVAKVCYRTLKGWRSSTVTCARAECTSTVGSTSWFSRRASGKVQIVHQNEHDNELNPLVEHGTVHSSIVQHHSVELNMVISWCASLYDLLLRDDRPEMSAPLWRAPTEMPMKSQILSCCRVYRVAFACQQFRVSSIICVCWRLEGSRTTEEANARNQRSFKVEYALSFNRVHFLNRLTLNFRLLLHTHRLSLSLSLSRLLVAEPLHVLCAKYRVCLPYWLPYWLISAGWASPLHARHSSIDSATDFVWTCSVRTRDSVFQSSA